jgi:hypothetical protein
MKLLDFIFTNFWHWLGAMVLLYTLTSTFVGLINKILRHRNIRKHGYPPSHCDADGQFPSTVTWNTKENEDK